MKLYFSLYGFKSNLTVDSDYSSVCEERLYVQSGFLQPYKKHESRWTEDCKLPLGVSVYSTVFVLLYPSEYCLLARGILRILHTQDKAPTEDE